MEKKTQEAKEIEKKAKKANRASVWAEFKKFISRGNVLDLAVGVIIGGAFNAIVTAFTNILLSVCTWGVPGGLKGLITVLPAANSAQAGMNPTLGLDQQFDASELQALATKLAVSIYGETDATAAVIEAQKTTILNKYTLHGSSYVYNLSASIDWGTFINTIISFFIIAITLFVIVKVAASLSKSREDYKEKLLEDYYKKHPEERPAPVVPGAPAPTETQLLTQIRDLLKEQKASVDKPEGK